MSKKEQIHAVTPPSYNQVSCSGEQRLGFLMHSIKKKTKQTQKEFKRKILKSQILHLQLMPRQAEILVDFAVSRKCFPFIVPIITCSNFLLLCARSVSHKMVAEQPQPSKTQ